MSMEEQLEAMGFAADRVAMALKATDGKSVEQAIDWLDSHAADAPPPEPMATDADSQAADAPPPEPMATDADSHAADAPPPEPMPTDAADGEQQSTVTLVEPPEPAAVANSLKCLDCHAVFANVELASIHAERTQHANFAESADELKQLTAEEKKKKLADLQKKLYERRAARDEGEKKQRVEMELKRRKQGQEAALAKQRLQEKEMKEIAEERKREKVADRKAKERVLEQIKRDREAQARERQAQTAVAAPPKEPKEPTAAVAKARPSYDECQLQIRLLDGSTIKQTFKAKEPLSAVRLFVELNRTDGTSPFRLKTTFPRREFTDEHMDMPLDQLDLVPSANIILAPLPNA